MAFRWHPRWGIVLVRGRSMAPTFAGWRRFPVVDYRRRPVVGDVVVAVRLDGLRLVKRVTGHDETGWWLESDAAEPGTVFSDSWVFGPLADDRILGVVVWPKPARLP